MATQTTTPSISSAILSPEILEAIKSAANKVAFVHSSQAGFFDHWWQVFGIERLVVIQPGVPARRLVTFAVG